MLSRCDLWLVVQAAFSRSPCRFAVASPSGKYLACYCENGCLVVLTLNFEAVVLRVTMPETELQCTRVAWIEDVRGSSVCVCVFPSAGDFVRLFLVIVLWNRTWVVVLVRALTLCLLCSFFHSHRPVRGLPRVRGECRG